MGKFYRLRKAVQEAVVSVLRSLGEFAAEQKTNTAKNVKPLERQIETALDGLSSEFPELETLLGTRRGQGVGAKKEDNHRRKELEPKGDGEVLAEVTSVTLEDKSKNKEKIEKGEHTASRKKPGLTLALEDLSDARDTLGRMIEGTVSVNTLHPAWKKALETKQEEYHILVVVGLVLADFVAPEKHPLEFLAKFLSSWSTVGYDSPPSTQGSLL